jgi:type IV secretory pathway VirJ component
MTGVLAIGLLAAAVAGGPTRPTEPTLEVGRFGAVSLYGSAKEAGNVVLFVSGDGGWNQGVVDMARELSGLDALVVGIDIRKYLAAIVAGTESCTYAASDFEALSQIVQKRLGRPSYTAPVLVGYSSGATLVYAVLVQAPPGTFAGAISMGFCPDLPLSRPFCRGHGLEAGPGPRGKGVSFLPTTTLERPWIALQGDIDQVCDPAATKKFVSLVPRGELVELPKVGHGYSVPHNWLPQFKAAFTRLTRPPVAPAAVPQAVSDLPLVEMPASGEGRALAVIVSGDGGWAGLDREVAGALARRGVAVVGIDALRYFWSARTPDGLAADLARVAGHYLSAWHRERLIMVGYSFGAEVLPFAVNRLPGELHARTDLVALLAPGRTAQFEFHVGEWLGASAADALPVKPELERIEGSKVLCFFGADETDSGCAGLSGGQVTLVPMRGGHHFAGAFQAVASRILAESGAGAP